MDLRELLRAKGGGGSGPPSFDGDDDGEDPWLVIDDADDDDDDVAPEASAVTDNNTRQKTPTCLMDGCKNSSSHQTSRCERYMSLSVAGRWKVVDKPGTCIGCLGQGHNRAQCGQARPCSVDGCGDEHHPSLHMTATTTTTKDRSSRQKFSGNSRRQQRSHQQCTTGVVRMPETSTCLIESCDKADGHSMARSGSFRIWLKIVLLLI